MIDNIMFLNRIHASAIPKEPARSSRCRSAGRDAGSSLRPVYSHGTVKRDAASKGLAPSPPAANPNDERCELLPSSGDKRTDG